MRQYPNSNFALKNRPKLQSMKLNELIMRGFEINRDHCAEHHLSIFYRPHIKIVNILVEVVLEEYNTLHTTAGRYHLRRISFEMYAHLSSQNAVLEYPRLISKMKLMDGLAEINLC